jgi:hypothetical protein
MIWSIILSITPPWVVFKNSA